MDPNIQTILNRGFVTGDSLLDPLAMRPFINARGESVVMVPTGRVVINSQGKAIPQYAQKKVYTNALLRKYEWELIDAEVMDVMRAPLVGVADLLSNGLTKSLGDIGVSISTYEQLSDMSAANVSMSVTPRKGENDRVEFTPQSIPIPIISKPFTLDLRTLTASRRGGEGLDVTQSRTATVKVRQAMEDMLFNGSDLIVNTFVIYGYTNHPKRLTDTAGAFGGGDFATDGNGHKTLVGMITALKNRGVTGPFGAYISNTQYAQLLSLTGDGDNSNTQLSVIMRTIPDLKFVKSSDRLDSAVGETVVVSLTKETVDLAIGMDVTPVSWAEYGGMVNEFRIMAASAPRVKFDANDTCGVAHATGC